MASTILAVDDSVTMRKVLEITFAGPEFRCVAVNGHDAALEKLKTEKPALVIADVTLEGKSGYDLCKAIKHASPATQVLILSSKQNPYDQAKGSSAQADDHIDKPYDSTAMIDKVKKMLAAPAKPVEAPKAAAAPIAAPTPVPAAPAKPAAAVPTAAAAAPPQRAKTMLYNPGGVNAGLPGAPAAATKPEPALSKTDVSAKPAVAAAVNGGQLSTRLEEMGLTPTQIEGVLALSREVVERVVWEVVPVLAETLIKEEIARLTK